MNAPLFMHSPLSNGFLTICDPRIPCPKPTPPTPKVVISRGGMGGSVPVLVQDVVLLDVFAVATMVAVVCTVPDAQISVKSEDMGLKALAKILGITVKAGDDDGLP